MEGVGQEGVGRQGMAGRAEIGGGVLSGLQGYPVKGAAQEFLMLAVAIFPRTIVRL